MKARIAVLGGDGIGPEVTAEAVRVLQAVAARHGHEFEFVEALVGGAAIDASGSPLPPRTIDACRSSAAVLLGAVGGPKWSDPSARVRPEQGLLELRRVLGVFANLRPVRTQAELLDASPLRPEVVAGVDIMVVRELTGGIYFGRKSRTAHEAEDVCSYTAAEIERVTRVAGRLAMGRRRKITSVDKANVLETSRLWRTVVERVLTSEFPEVQFEHMLVDAAAMHLLRRPTAFDVILTENMFGDILTDEASMLAGSMGLLPSASLGETTVGLYEPIHGSAPDIAGRGIANPFGTILSAAMLLRHSLALEAEATAVERAVSAALAAGVRTADITGPGAASVGSRAAGDAVIERLRTHAWPGNVRELEHVIKRSVLAARGPVLTVHDLSFEQDTGAADAARSEVERLAEILASVARRLVEAAERAEEPLPLHEIAMARLERALVDAAMERTGGNQVAASRLLGMNRSTFRTKLPD
jgi:3-isopropylmalate dehydrogenase